MHGRQSLDIFRYSAVSPEFCISRSTSTHRRTNSSGVSFSSVGVGSDELLVTDVGGGGSADDEESSEQAERESRPQHARAARWRFTTRTLPRRRQPSRRR